ncbi:MAG: hypothetical protein NTW19_11320 [Planctomycetota bacterium]|nr:hypothetical protein [Planctomycetota bacterium]
MGWKTAGTVTTFDFTGEEMIKSKDLGKRIVAGQELVQRQNYPSYEGRPLEFWLTVADSKGQETKTPIFKVHYAQEDYAARVERGLVHLAAIEASAAALKAGLAGIDNRMNILAAVAGQATRWPADKAPVLDDFLKQVRQVGPGGLDLNPQLIGGLPARIERSAAILTAARSMLSTGEDLVAPAEALRTSEDLPKAMADLRAAVQQATTAAELLRKAAGDERNRLLVEGLVQKGLACERRVAALLAKRGNKELFEANLAFVLSQVTALAEAAKPRLADHADEAEPIARLAAAAQGKKAEDSLASLTNLLRTWMSDSPGPAGSFTELQAWMATSAAGAGRDKAAAACETLLASRGRAELFEPQWILALARGAWGAFSAGDLGWTGAKPAAGDALRLAEQLRQDLAAYRLDLLSGRYTLQPDWAADRAAELREQMLAISDLCATAEPRSDFQAGFFATAAYFKSWRLHESLGPRGEALLGAIGQNLHAAPRTLASPAPDPLAASGASLAVAMRRTAEEAEAHAEAIKAFAARTDRPAPETAAAAGVFQAVGRTITRRIEAIEAAGRALTTAWVAARLLRAGPAAPWEEAEHAHAQSLSLTWLALTAREKLVDSHFARTGDVGKWPALYAGTESAARAMAAELRSAAPLVEAGAKPDGGGTASHGDIAGWVTRLNAGGHLEAIKAEHESVAALLAVPRDAKAAAGVLERVKASVLGQSLAASRLAAQAALARLRLRSWEVGPAERIAELKTTAKSLEMLEDRGLQDTLVRAIRAVETSTSAAATQAVNTPPRTATAPTSAPASQPTAAFHDGLAERDRATVEATLDAAVASLSTLARPPAAKALVASARRNLSGIAGLANLADRRWAQRLREAETELVAAMVDAGESSPDAAQALALQASRLWELRARNITQERRGNRGVSALAAEDVVTIRLPKHIEAELTKARNTKSPAAFKEWIEAYYANLYRDLAP